ncbi:uncharacterized protein [Nicotiana sylvestris]|uniref:uncharacterized protein n=1 Tax=Nicotiana sylvestris TaxID=4096 RepID=UPI00388CA4FA
MTFDRSRTVREHIMGMRDIAAKLKSLVVDMSELFHVHFILNSLPAEYGPFKISYNTHKDKWSINELLTMCVQEEERLKHEIPESVNMVTRGKRNAKKGKSVPMKKKNTFDKDVCRFFSDNTWWIDSGSTIHIAKIMQGFLTQRKSIGSEQYVYSGNRTRSRLEEVGIYWLILKDEQLDAFNVYKTEVEKQTGAQIKIVRSDKGGEYYGRYTDKGQVKGPFAEFLESEGIIAQYTMPGTPQ